MNTKFLSLLFTAGFAFASGAEEPVFFTGGIDRVFPFFGATGSYDAASLTLGATNLMGTGTRTFVPLFASGITADTATITGLSTSPATENIPDFFLISSQILGAHPGNGNEYSFTLLSLTDAGLGVFSGTGTLIDSDGVLADTPAEFSLSFGPGGTPSGTGEVYNITLTALSAPEPGTISLVAAGLLGALALRRRKKCS